MGCYSRGLSDREIAKVLFIHHNTAGYWREKLNLPANGTTRKALDKRGNTKARCSKCLKIKGLNQFTSNRKGKPTEYKISYCHACRKVVLQANLNKSIESFLGDRHNRLKLRCKIQKKICTITREELIKQYYLQDGLCFYTDKKLDWGVGKGYRRDALSIDCVIPENGYANGNVVLSTHKANTVKTDLTLDEIKDWLPGWHARISKFFQITNSEGC